MNIIYSLSTAPFRAKSANHADFTIDKFELYTAALSSITRQKAGDTTVMHCDTLGAEYLRRIGLSPLWNDIITTIPDDLGGINPAMFWAAGKLFALETTPCPFIHLDTDFIAWRLPELTAPVIAAHREDLTPQTYPPVTTFQMNEGYTFPQNMSYSPQPLNTAFLYLQDDGFKQYYVEQAFAFMRAAKDCDDYLTYMVYAEQRLLAILAAHKRIQVNTLFDLKDAHKQRSFTHTWGAKQVMRDNKSEHDRFCEKCRRRIRQSYPENTWLIDTIDKL